MALPVAGRGCHEAAIVQTRRCRAVGAEGPELVKKALLLSTRIAGADLVACPSHMGPAKPAVPYYG